MQPEKEVLSQEVAKVTMCKLSCCTSQYGSTRVKKDGTTEWTFGFAFGINTEVLNEYVVNLTGYFLQCFEIKKNRSFEKSCV